MDWPTLSRDIRGSYKRSHGRPWTYWQRSRDMEAFCGDPHEIIVFGQSARGISVGTSLRFTESQRPIVCRPRWTNTG